MVPTEKELEILKNENLELKLSDIRKDMTNLKIDLHQHLDRILEQATLTNGSVARALDRIYTLERQDNKVKIDKITKEFEQYKQSMKFWHVVADNKWVTGIIFLVFYGFAIQEFREALFSIFKFL